MVEDTEELLATVAEYLHIQGFDVIATANATDALAALDSGKRIDLVFTDVNMPGPMDGAGLARWISVNRPDLPVLLTSGESAPDLRRTSTSWHFVSKPYSLDLLEQDVREIIAISGAH